MRYGCDGSAPNPPLRVVGRVWPEELLAMTALASDAPTTTSDAPSTLAGLVSPLTEAEFLGLLRRRELAYQPGASGDRYASLLGWSALRCMIESGNYPSKRPDDIRV